MRRALYASGGMHAALILWVAVGGLVRPSPEVEFEVTGVTILSAAEFETLTTPVDPTPVALETPPVPELPETATAPEAPSAEETPPEVAQPDPTPAPEPEVEPEAVDPIPQAEVTDTLAPLAPPSGAPDLPPETRPTPREAPRIAPLPAPAQEPDVEVAPEIVDQPTEADESPTPVEEQPPTAPEEATTEVVTEAEEPSGGPLGPIASVRPTARPNRPAPAEPVETAAPAPEEPNDPIADAVAAAVAEATAAPETPTTPSSPPISAAVREGFIIAVRNCWNVGSLSSEAQGTTVVLSFTMARDGRPDAVSMRLVSFSDGSEAAAQQSYEAARRAILRCGVNGYDLPEESYDRWQQVEMTFNPQGMRLR